MWLALLDALESLWNNNDGEALIGSRKLEELEDAFRAGGKLAAALKQAGCRVHKCDKRTKLPDDFLVLNLTCGYRALVWYNAALSLLFLQEVVWSRHEYDSSLYPPKEKCWIEAKAHVASHREKEDTDAASDPDGVLG